jgi:hypothetical protein
MASFPRMPMSLSGQPLTQPIPAPPGRAALFGRRLLTWAGLLVGSVALVVQFAVSIALRLGVGDDIFGALGFVLTFFTILTNLMLVLVYLSSLVPGRWLSWWRSPVTRAMLAAAILVVMVFYHFVLAGLWQPDGILLFCDVLLHYVCPVLFILWWLLVEPHGRLRFQNVPWMLLPPLLYVIATMGRGALVDEYPYPILDAGELGYPPVLVNIGALLVAFAALCGLAVWLDGLLARRKS